MNGNLIYHTQSFAWDDLNLNRGKEVESFINLTDFVRNQNDQIVNNQEIFNLKLNWGYFTDIIYGIVPCSWMTITQRQALQNKLTFQPVVDNYQTLKVKNLNQNNGEIGLPYQFIPSSIVVKEEDWYQFHFDYLKANVNKWIWNHDYFPNLKYWRTKDDELSYSDLVIIEFMDQKYKGKYKSAKEKIKGFYSVAIATGGEYRKLTATEKVEFCRRVVERNFYNHEQELSSKESQFRGGDQRKIYSILKNNKILYLSIDHENGLFEVCNESGKHQGVINLSGDWKNNKDDSGMHDIWSITKK